MRKNCEYCGQFMRLTDRMPQDDEFDEELAVQCGLSDEQIEEGMWNSESPHSRFNYVQDQWECTNCGTLTTHETGPRYYWNPDSGNYDGEKPLTPAERIQAENVQQEAVGQLRLPMEGAV